MSETDKRLQAIEHQGSVLRIDVDALRVDVSALRTDMSTLRTEVSTLRTDVNALRIEGENTRDLVRLVAEVQVQHGHRLTVIEAALEPIHELREMHALLKTVVGDHERRITALEHRDR